MPDSAESWIRSGLEYGSPVRGIGFCPYSGLNRIRVMLRGLNNNGGLMRFQRTFAAVEREASMDTTQPAFIRAMHDPNFYPHPAPSLSFTETHISWVFLTGDYVYKVKKPVDLGFLDFTTLEKRERYCRREVTLNRRLTTDVYLDVLSITERADGFELGGDGSVVDYAIKMAQLSPEDSLEERLPGNTIDTSVIELLARTLSRFYAEADRGDEIDQFGAKAVIEKNCLGNFDRISDDLLDADERRRLRIIQAATRSFIDTHETLFTERVAAGAIRDCHGDLRTDHIYFTEHGIQILDCIEFNQRFRYIDVASDLAFLAMELDYRGYPRVAGVLLAAVADDFGDTGLFGVLDFYKCYRAMVRVKVNSLRMEQPDTGEAERASHLKAIRGYLDLAFRYALQFSRPMLWVVCGMVAAGKSTVAHALADALSIRVIRSDVVRKEVMDIPEGESSVAAFERGFYSPEATSLTYGRLLIRAQEEMAKGRSVVLDATFGKAEHRREALRLADEAGALVLFVACVCSEETIRERLLARTGTDSVSDARIQHFESIKAAFEPMDELSRRCRVRVDTEKPVDECLRTIFTYTATPKECLERGWLA